MSIIELLLSWTHLPHWVSELLVVALACLGVGGGVMLYDHHERGIGAVKCEATIQKADEAQEVHNAATQARDSTVVQQEAKDYASAVAAPVIRPVRVFISPPTIAIMPTAPVTGPGSDAAPAHGSADNSGPVPPQSFGPELQAIGHDADAQIAGLQDYINKVCIPR